MNVRVAVLLVAVLCPGVGWAQQLACRTLPAGSAAPSLGQVEAWPRLVDELFLGRDVSADLLSDGSAVVLQRAKAELVRVDRRTGRVTLLARKGQGPGEVGGAASLAVTAGDTIAVLDRSKLQLLRLRPQGGLVSATPYRSLGLPVLLAAAGRDVIEITRNRPLPGKAEAITMAIRVFTPGSARVARKADLADPAAEPGLFTPVGFGALLDSSHVLLASGVIADVNLLSLGGAGDSIIHLPIGAPRKMTRALAEHVLTQALTQFALDQRRRLVASVLGQNPLVAHFPAFARLVVGRSGALWVQRAYMSDGSTESDEVPTALSMDDLGGFVWLQVASTGRAAAECRTPTDWRVVLARRGEVVFARDDGANTQLFSWRP